MKSAHLLASACVLMTAVQAHAWSYTCAEQTISGKKLDSLRISNSYGDFVTVRYSIDGKGSTVPTLLPDGDNDFFSHDRDVEVMINPLTDEQGVMAVDLTIKSLGVDGRLDCAASLY